MLRPKTAITYTPYIVTRDYKLFGQESSLESKSHVIAEITVVPPDSKNTSSKMPRDPNWEKELLAKCSTGR